jgi:MFS family permease
VLSTLLPLFARDRLGMSTTATGVAFAVAAAAELVILVPAGTAIDRRGRRAVLVPALTVTAAATAAAGIAPTPIVLMVAIGLLGLASGGVSVAPGAMVADAVDERDRPLALGWFRLAGDVGFALGPLIVGVLIDTQGFAAAFAVAALPAAITLLLAARLRR